MLRVIEFAHKIIKDKISVNDICVDMTIGNGHDTLFLSRNCKFVYGFDIQKQAIDNTTKLLNTNNVNNYKLFLTSHENVNELVNEKVKAFIFNLGYLPSADKTITTLYTSTINAINNALKIIDEKGVMRNQLAVFTADGKEFCPYTKVHLVEPEIAKGIIAGEGAEVFEIDGIRYGAAICFDYYFPELFVDYAKKRIDVMIVASHQRQERPEILDFVTRARAFDCGCTLLRCAPAMYTEDVGGKTMAVAPDGKVIADAGGKAGVLYCEINPKARFMRAASFGEPDKIGDYRETLMLSRSHFE